MGKIADLSHHQDILDWSKVAKELDLAIIRVQYGSKVIDDKYKEFVAACKKNGIPFGHYAYARFVNVADAKVEANDFISRADKAAKFLVVDVEEQTCNSVKDLVPATQAFIDVCKKAGYKVGLYTGHSFYSEHGMNKVKADFLWIPRYAGDDNGQATGPKPTMAADMWQFTQCGKVNGIKGAVDLNQLVGSKKLDWYIGKAVAPVKAAAKKPAVKVGTSKVDPTKKYHTVVSGDTVSELAADNKTTVAQIKTWNKLADKDEIFVGEKLRVK